MIDEGAVDGTADVADDAAAELDGGDLKDSAGLDDGTAEEGSADV